MTTTETSIPRARARSKVILLRRPLQAAEAEVITASAALLTADRRLRRALARYRAARAAEGRR